MREIKFRLWSKEYQEMFVNEILSDMYRTMAELAIKNIKSISESRVEMPLTGIILPFQDDAILMQYTGLKDKTGKEIYEGDIIVVGEDDGNPSFRYIIQWVDDSACFLARQNKTSGYIGTGYGLRDWLVVGNIHDNPELLER